jgi:tight adherence protein C
MIVILFSIGILMIAAAAVLVTRAALMSRTRVASQVRQIGTYGFHPIDAAGARESGASFRVQLSRFAERIGGTVSGSSLLAPVEQRVLNAAGMFATTPQTFQGYRLMAAVGGPGLLLLVAGISGSFTTTTALMVVCAAGVCWLLPPAMVKSRAGRRMDQLDRSLPELIDVLIATVESGLGFAGSLRLVTGRFTGPLGQELRLMLQEQSLGLSTERALRNLVERCDTPSVRAFARAISQGEALGVSVGAMLRNLAGETRMRRRQSAREKIMKAPVKMLFPLVMLILPALFLVLLYPAFSTLLHTLGTH